MPLARGPSRLQLLLATKALPILRELTHHNLCGLVLAAIGFSTGGALTAFGAEAGFRSNG